jgi:hypothetical protein
MEAFLLSECAAGVRVKVYGVLSSNGAPGNDMTVGGASSQMMPTTALVLDASSATALVPTSVKVISSSKAAGKRRIFLSRRTQSISDRGNTATRLL